MLKLRWSSQFGAIFVDGSHFKVLLVGILDIIRMCAYNCIRSLSFH